MNQRGFGPTYHEELLLDTTQNLERRERVVVDPRQFELIFFQLDENAVPPNS